MTPKAETRLLLISAVRNEAGHFERVAASVAGQTRPPDVWLVIDDGSTDGTLEKLERLEREIEFLRVIRSSGGEDDQQRDRLAVAAEARAFNEALRCAPWREFTHLGKFDGDVELPTDYFEQLLGEFRSNPRLGIAGGQLVERHGSRLRRIRIPPYHVHGALKLYRRDCFEAIGGITEWPGWDTIDETYARIKGWETRSFPSLVGFHIRHLGTAYGALRGRARHGRSAYQARYGLAWVLLRSFKVATQRPIGASGAAFLYGYLAAHARRAPRIEDEHFKRFVRRELRRRLFAPLARRPTSGALPAESQQFPP